MSLKERTFTSEKGAVFVQVGISIFVMMAFNVFVLDYGMMWVGRRQAQNAADAGALAAGTALAYDDFTSPPSSTGVAAQSAQQVVAQNLVWQQAGTPEVLFTCPPGVTGNCAQVNVYRNGQNGSTSLPTLFGPIFGINDQGVRATATAIVATGNATNCLRPIAFPDDWLDQRTPSNQFDSVDETTGLPLTVNPDVYTAPSSTQSGRTTNPADLGKRIIWQLGAAPLTSPIRLTPENSTLTTLVLALTLPGSTTANFQQDVNTCSGQMVELGDTLTVSLTPPPAATFSTLLAQDPTVLWNEGNNRIDNSCAPACAPISPRLIPVALFDPNRFQLGRASGNWTAVGCPTNSPCITVTNIIGFFLHGVAGMYGPHGHFLKYPAMTSPTAPSLVDDASWLVSTHLIR
jgi:Flp pilus assembly protein TadG